MTDEKRLFKAIRLAKGKEEVFRNIYNKYKPLVFFVCSRYLKNEFEINDAVQETFVDLFKSPLDACDNLKGYLVITAKHNCLDVIRKRARNPVLLNIEQVEGVIDSGLTVEERVCSHDAFNDLIDRMKSCLKSEDIDIILLHVTEGFTFDEIALKKGANVKTVKSKYYRALKKLKKRMEN